MARLRDVPYVLRTVGPVTFATRVWTQGSEDQLMTWASALAYSWLGPKNIRSRLSPMKPSTPAAGRMHSYFGAAQRKCQHPLRLAYSARRGMLTTGTTVK